MTRTARRQWKTFLEEEKRRGDQMQSDLLNADKGTGLTAGIVADVRTAADYAAELPVPPQGLPDLHRPVSAPAAGATAAATATHRLAPPLATTASTRRLHPPPLHGSAAPMGSPHDRRQQERQHGIRQLLPHARRRPKGQPAPRRLRPWARSRQAHPLPRRRRRLQRPRHPARDGRRRILIPSRFHQSRTVVFGSTRLSRNT